MFIFILICHIVAVTAVWQFPVYYRVWWWWWSLPETASQRGPIHLLGFNYFTM